jgi:hypothetical protein
MSYAPAANSSATHPRLIEGWSEAGDTPFITRRKQLKAPRRKGETPMKSKKTLVLAASILALTLSAFPHDAAADSGTTPPPTTVLVSKGTHIRSGTITMILVESLLTLL